VQWVQTQRQQLGQQQKLHGLLVVVVELLATKLCAPRWLRQVSSRLCSSGCSNSRPRVRSSGVQGVLVELLLLQAGLWLTLQRAQRGARYCGQASKHLLLLLLLLLLLQGSSLLLRPLVLPSSSQSKCSRNLQPAVRAGHHHGSSKQLAAASRQSAPPQPAAGLCHSSSSRTLRLSCEQPCWLG
jgi:hypothetical protein